MDPLTIMGIAGSVGNTVSSMATNKKNRDHQLKMYNLQRGHALEDWNRVNEYNDPTNQVARLRKAGLNINTQFGKGSGNAGTAGSIDRPAMQDFNFQDPRAGDVFRAIPEQISRIYSMKNQQAQTNLVEEKVRSEKLGQAMQLLKNSDAKIRSEWNRKHMSDLLNSTLAKSQADASRAITEDVVSYNNERRRQEHWTLDTVAKELDNSYKLSRNQSMKLQNQLRKLQIQFEELGMDKAPWLIKPIARLMAERLKKGYGSFKKSETNY